MNKIDNYENLLDLNLINNLVVGISEVSEITGVPTRKIRYWEDKNIIKSQSEKGSVRRYNYINIKKILLINELLEDGYTLEAAAQKVEKRLETLDVVFEKLALKDNNSK